MNFSLSTNAPGGIPSPENPPSTGVKGEARPCPGPPSIAVHIFFSQRSSRADWAAPENSRASALAGARPRRVWEKYS